MDKILMPKPPKISVLMPVYNGEEYLGEAIDSILNQTFTDFEFIIVNDGSTDSGREIILSYNDSRIQLIDNLSKMGVASSLNIGINTACGEYIARMDADDISMPKRFEKQIVFLENNHEIEVCGTSIEYFGAMNYICNLPSDHYRIRCMLLFHTSISHSTVMFRHSLLSNNNIYYSNDYPHAEDYELWVRLSQKYILANIDEILLKRRTHPNQVTKTNKHQQNESADKIRVNQVLEIIPTATGQELKIHNKIGSYDTKTNFSLPEAKAWLNKLAKANAVSKYYLEKELKEVLTEKWLMLCWANKAYGAWLKSFFEGNSGIGKCFSVKIFFKSFIGMIRKIIT